MMSSITRACDSLDDGDVRGALEHALEAWRAHRDPMLAGYIEALGHALPLAAPFTTTGRALHREIRERIAADDPADVELVVATPLPRGWADLATRLRALTGRSPDPRIATYLHRLIAAPPTNRGTFWRELFAAIATVGDPRSLDELRDFAPRLREVVGGSQAATVRNRLAEATEHLRARSTPPLGPADRKALARLGATVEALAVSARAATADGAALVAAVRADPRDELALAVYADYLQQRDDPRGELIALQLADRAPARQRALIAKHAKTWLGPVATVTTAKYTRFARGLPVAVTVNPRNEPTLDAAVGAPEWSTIEELSFTGMFAEAKVCARLVCDPVMRALRDVRGLGSIPMQLVARAKTPLPITHLTIRPYVASALARAPGLPSLARVTASGAALVRDILDVLAVPLPYELAFTDGETRYVLPRAREVLRIELLDLAKPGISLRELPAMLRALPKLRAVEVAVTDPSAAGLEAKLARMLGAIWRDRGRPCHVVALASR